MTKKRVNSCAKGKNGERELSHELNKYGFNTHRGLQFKGGYDSPDVVGLPGIHIECKRYQNQPSAQMLESFLDQAERDCEGKALPTVFRRADRHGWEVTMRLCYFSELLGARSDMQGVVTISLGDWVDLYKGWLKNGGKTDVYQESNG